MWPRGHAKREQRTEQMDSRNAEREAVAFAEKVIAHMITKQANEALANYEAKSSSSQS